MEEKTVLQFNSGRLFSTGSKGQKTIQEGVSFEIAEGESLALVGKTGSGKTMIALEIMNLLPEGVQSENSRIILNNGTQPETMDSKARLKLSGNQIAYIPQNGMEYLNPYRKIIKQIADNENFRGLSKAEAKLKASELLELAGLDESFANRYPFQLSGGQCQKVCIAMAASGKPLLLIADEPTNGLDEDGRRNFVALLEKVFPKAAKIIITHDPKLAALCTKEVKLEPHI